MSSKRIKNLLLVIAIIIAVTGTIISITTIFLGITIPLSYYLVMSNTTSAVVIILLLLYLYTSNARFFEIFSLFSFYYIFCLQ